MMLDVPMHLFHLLHFCADLQFDGLEMVGTCWNLDDLAAHQVSNADVP